MVKGLFFSLIFSQLDVERAAFIVQQAFQEDEQNNTEEAVELYMEAVELCIKIVITFKNFLKVKV